MGILESFPPGRAIFALLLIGIITGISITLRPSERPADLVIWTFDARGLNNDAIEGFKHQTGKSVSVKLISTRAMDTRLLSQFMSPTSIGDSADLVEIEIGSVGKFFRPPVDQIGFRPLTDDLLRSGLGARFLNSRLAAWTKDGVVFGLPQDVHPVTLTYRKDLFDAAGIDLTQCATWPQLQRRAEQFDRYWIARGISGRRALMLSASAADDLIVMLQQRHVCLLDSSNRVNLAGPIVAQTVLFYAGLIAGHHAVAAEPSPGTNQWIHDLEAGDLCMLFTPDWRVSELKSSAPGLAGKLGMLPLPRFDPGDAPTGSWGGTMIGLPREGRHPQDAWALAEALTNNPPPGVLPALLDRWHDPTFHQPDPFFAGDQSIGQLYVTLAAQLPPRVVTSFSIVADTELADVLSKAIALARQHPDRDERDPDSLRQCTAWLASAAADLQDRIRLGTF